jgi:hypothetical protein
MTAQFGDHLQYDNQLYTINTEPLNIYLMQFDPYPFKSSSTACWRGYIAKWEISNNILFLKSLNGTISDYTLFGIVSHILHPQISDIYPRNVHKSVEMMIEIKKPLHKCKGFLK